MGPIKTYEEFIAPYSQDQAIKIRKKLRLEKLKKIYEKI